MKPTAHSHSDMRLPAVRFDLGFGGFKCTARGVDVGEQAVITAVRIHLVRFPKRAEGFRIRSTKSRAPFDEAHTNLALNFACHTRDSARLSPFSNA